jgi:hypothetical protein
MKLSILLLLCLLSTLQHVSAADPVPTYPSITLDDAHLMLKHADGTEGKSYEIPPAEGLVVHVGSYHFQIPPQLKVDAPNSVNVILGKDQQYLAHWEPQGGKQVLNRATLTPVGKAPPFGGFHTGDTIVIGIGLSAIHDAKLSFSVIWVSMAKVK